MSGHTAPPSPTAREAGAAERESISRTLASAFQDDPVMCFLLPDPDERRRRLPGLFRLLYASDQPAGACFVTQAGEAATLWRAPGSPHETLAQTLLHGLPYLRALGPAILRGLAYSFASDANHPPEPHWYLHIAGCDPAHQGQGHGRAAIRAGLDRADRDGVAAYLETSTERNIGYYQTFGFATTHEWRPRGGPRTWSMLRPRGD